MRILAPFLKNVDSVGLGQGLRFCISYKLPSNADTLSQGPIERSMFGVHQGYLGGLL